MVLLDSRSVGHGLESTSNHDVPDTKLNVLGSKHDSLQSRGTDLVDGRSIRSVGDTAISICLTSKKSTDLPSRDTDLPSWTLSNTGRNDISKVDLFNLVG
jgi:hypothetical protein